MNNISSSLVSACNYLQAIPPNQNAVTELANQVIEQIDNSPKISRSPSAYQIGLSDIPTEILGVIFDFLTPPEIFPSFPLVSTSFNCAINDQFWKKHTLRDFPDSYAGLKDKTVTNWKLLYRDFLKYQRNFLAGRCRFSQWEYPNNKQIDQLIQANGMIIANSDQDISVWDISDPDKDTLFNRILEVNDGLKIQIVCVQDPDIYVGMSNRELWHFSKINNYSQRTVYKSFKVDDEDIDPESPVRDWRHKFKILKTHGDLLIGVTAKEKGYVWNKNYPDQEPKVLDSISHIIGFHNNLMVYSNKATTVLHVMNLKTFDIERQWSLGQDLEYFFESIKIAKGVLVVCGAHEKDKTAPHSEDPEDYDYLQVMAWNMDSWRPLYNVYTRTSDLPNSIVIVKDTVYCLRENDVIVGIDLFSGACVELREYLNWHWMRYPDREQISANEDFVFNVFNSVIHFPHHLLDLRNMHSVYLGNTKCVHDCYEFSAVRTAFVGGKILIRGYQCGAIDIFDFSKEPLPLAPIAEEEEEDEGDAVQAQPAENEYDFLVDLFNAEE